MSKSNEKVTVEFECVGEWPRVQVPEHMQGKRVRIVIEVVENADELAGVRGWN